MAYDPAEKIFFIDNSGIRWDTEDHIRDHFARIGVLQKKWAGGGPCDMIIGYVGFTFDMMKLGATYRELVIYAGTHYFKNLVRWGLDADPLLRSTQRAFAIKTHRKSHIYSSKEEALAVLRGLRDGSITFDTTEGA